MPLACTECYIGKRRTIKSSDTKEDVKQPHTLAQSPPKPRTTAKKPSITTQTPSQPPTQPRNPKIGGTAVVSSPPTNNAKKATEHTLTLLESLLARSRPLAEQPSTPFSTLTTRTRTPSSVASLLSHPLPHQLPFNKSATLDEILTLTTQQQELQEEQSPVAKKTKHSQASLGEAKYEGWLGGSLLLMCVG
jgi:hypothetical protein